MKPERKNIITHLSQGNILVADGAMGTMLFQRGLAAGECPELLNRDSPDVLQEIAREYLNAGAQIIQTNTFGGSALKLADYGLADQCSELNRLAVQHVRTAVGERAFVSGSCGPAGKLLEPYGDISPEIMRDSYRCQIEALLAGGVDMICIETMMDLREALLAVEVARAVDPDIPVMATMVFNRTAAGFKTMMGDPIAVAVSSLESAGADIVGSNCGNGIAVMLEIAWEIVACARLPVIIQSNAGLPEINGSNLKYNESPQYFAEIVPRMIEAGVAIIGGCCGTTPDHIRSIRRIVDSITNQEGQES